jgi:hypothetical protein
VDPVPDPLLLKKSGSACNRTRTSECVVKNSDQWITEAVNEYQKQKKIMFLGSRARPVRRDDKLTAICEPIVQKMWDPQQLTTL